MAEAVDPIILNMELVDVCQCRPGDCAPTESPQAILDCFGDSLTQGGDVHRLYVTLGQFSIIRLERDTQLLMPVYDYCMPEKECDCGSDCSQEDPCEVFLAAVPAARPPPLRISSASARRARLPRWPSTGAAGGARSGWESATGAPRRTRLAGGPRAAPPNDLRTCRAPYL